MSQLETPGSDNKTTKLLAYVAASNSYHCYVDDYDDDA
jgi:hypothetical protein